MSMDSNGCKEEFILVQRTNPKSFNHHHHQQQQQQLQELQEDSDGGGSGHGGTNSGSSGEQGNAIMDNDKKIRRQIANSNERRRMQSINAGFQSLRNLLPHHEGEKLSKAAILQQTAEYIYSLEQERTQLLSQNCYLKRLLDQHDVAQELQDANVDGSGGVINSTSGVVGATTTVTTTVDASGMPVTVLPSNKKRKLDTVMTLHTVSDSSDEGLGSMSPEPLTILLPAKTAAKLVNNTGVQQPQTRARRVKTTYQIIGESQLHQAQHHDSYTSEIIEQCVDDDNIEIDMDNATIVHEVVEEMEEMDDQEQIEHPVEDEQQMVLEEPPQPAVRERVTMVSASVAPLPKKKQRVKIEHELEDGVEIVTHPHNQLHTVGAGATAGGEMHELQVLSYDSELVLCSPFHEISYDSATGEVKTGSNATAKVVKTPGATKIVGYTTTTTLTPLDGLKNAQSGINNNSSEIVVEEKPAVNRTTAGAATATTNGGTTTVIALEKRGGTTAAAVLKQNKLQPILESFSKVEPKVEVERIANSPISLSEVKEDGEAAGGVRTRMFVSGSTSRQNLETIVEAIRHLEGDHLFDENTAAGKIKVERLELQPAQDAPLALTTKATSVRPLQSEMSQFLNFRQVSGFPQKMTARVVTSASAATESAAAASAGGQTTAQTVHQLQQCRPGVIVVKPTTS